jgi:3-hydroxymyristoyl/3-hydroxydecanoyl-(acyl carrier protein) dehydratase
MLVTLAPDSPFFAGHFPGHPILPGIAHLALAAEALGGASITEIPALRLRSPVRPGDVLSVKIDGPTDAGAVRFELRRGEEVASNGSLRLGSFPEIPEIPDMEEMPAPFPPVAALLPHAPPARLVRNVLAVSPEGLTGVAEIPGGSPFAAAGLAPAFLGFEAAAQGAAVLEALLRQDQNDGGGASGPRIGYLVALRGARCAVGTLPVERPFRFAVRLTGSAPPLSIYEVTVAGAGGAEILRGAISTFLPPES